MKIEEAYLIIKEYEKWENRECYCRYDNALCGKCTDQPNDEEYAEALKLIEQFEKEKSILDPASPIK